AIERTAVRVGGVFDECDALLVAQRAQRGQHRTHQAADVYRDDCRRRGGQLRADVVEAKLIVAGSPSTDFTRAPACTAAAAVAKNVLAGTRTSRPSTLSARRMISSALVPELTAIACVTP